MKSSAAMESVIPGVDGFRDFWVVPGYECRGSRVRVLGVWG